MLYQLSYTPAARWKAPFIEASEDRQSSLQAGPIAKD